MRPDARPADGTLGILGTGLIGASIGLQARAAGRYVVGADTARESAEAARRRGAIDETVTDLDGLLGAVETLVLAAPLDGIVDALHRLAARARDERRAWPRLILDVGSVKLPVCVAGRGVPAFVATHPIAGSDRSGPRAADAGLFVGKAWPYVPSGDRALDGRAEAFIAAMGAHPFAIPAEAHDAAVALTSHLPQSLSVVLGAHLAPRLDDPDIRALCGPGMMSMLRLGRSPWSMWRGVYAANAAAVARELHAIAAAVSAFADAVEAHDESALAARFAKASEAMERIAANRPASHDVIR